MPIMMGGIPRRLSIDDLVDHVVGKVLDRLGIERAGAVRWAGLDEPPREPGTEPPADEEPS